MDILLENQTLKLYFFLGLAIILFMVSLLVINKNINPTNKVIGIGLLLFIPPVGILYSLYMLLFNKVNIRN